MSYEQFQATQAASRSIGMVGNSMSYDDPMNAPTQESPASQELGRLTSAISELEIQLENLRSALSPVMRMMPPEGQGAATKVEGSRGVVVDTIAASSERCSGILKRIEMIRSALTV